MYLEWNKVILFKKKIYETVATKYNYIAHNWHDVPALTYPGVGLGTMTGNLV